MQEHNPKPPILNTTLTPTANPLKSLTPIPCPRVDTPARPDPGHIGFRVSLPTPFDPATVQVPSNVPSRSTL